MELTAGFPCALLSVEGFKADDLIRDKDGGPDAETSGSGIWNVAEGLGKGLRQILLGIFNYYCINIENGKY